MSLFKTNSKFIMAMLLGPFLAVIFTAILAPYLAEWFGDKASLYILGGIICTSLVLSVIFVLKK